MQSVVRTVRGFFLITKELMPPTNEKRITWRWVEWLGLGSSVIVIILTVIFNGQARNEQSRQQQSKFVERMVVAESDLKQIGRKIDELSTSGPQVIRNDQRITDVERRMTAIERIEQDVRTIKRKVEHIQ